MANAPVLEHLYAALRSQSGVRLRVTEGTTVQAKAALYKARKDAMDARLDNLSITDSPTDPQEVWIVHKTKGEADGPA